MDDLPERAYGVGRVAFGAALIAAPAGFGRLLVGDEARVPSVRIALRTYGTRDVVLGAGALSAVAGGKDVSPWLAAGVAADLLDAGVQAVEWGDLPPDRRIGGLLAALGSAAAGLALLALRRSR